LSARTRMPHPPNTPARWLAAALAAKTTAATPATGLREEGARAGKQIGLLPR
jgi:hypothetical protein